MSAQPRVRDACTLQDISRNTGITPGAVADTAVVAELVGDLHESRFQTLQVNTRETAPASSGESAPTRSGWLEIRLGRVEFDPPGAFVIQAKCALDRRWCLEAPMTTFLKPGDVLRARL